MSKHIELGKKLKALADKGVGGEKINAEKMLNALLKKHDITIEEIEGEELDYYFFNISDKDFDMFNQIVKRVNYDMKIYGRFPKKIIKEGRLAGDHMLKCTASEYIEIEAKYNFYKKPYQEETEIFWVAFCKANDLLVDNPNREDKEMTKEEYERWKRINDLSKDIIVGKFMKQLTESK